MALSSIAANAHRPSRSTASRVTRPVGSPFASRSTPSWSDRIPAASSAAEFASAMCPSARWITRGRGVDGVELREGGVRRVVPARLVEAEHHHGPLSFGRALARERQQLSC